MPRQNCPRRIPGAAAALLALVALALAACAATPVTPSASPGTNASTAPRASTPPGSDVPGASNGPAATPGGSSALAATPPAAGATLTPTTEPFTPPPAGDPQDDSVCLAVIPRADVERALGKPVSDIVAQGTDPSVSLSCTFTTTDGDLLLTTLAGDAATGFQSDMDNATAYGQAPANVDGIGDGAFYAKSEGRWPEQLVFTKGPVLVRLWSHEPAPIGQTALAGLAATVADAIHGEIPPAP